MKNISAGTIPLLLLLLTLASCSKSENTGASQPVTIIKDCTGYYLRQGNLDYPVCNRESVKSYEDGDSLQVAFTEVNDCTTGPLTFCAMVHSYPTGSWVFVSRID